MAPANVRGLTTNREYDLEPTAVAAGGFGGVFPVKHHSTLIAKILHRPHPLDSEYTRRVKAVISMDLRDARIVRVVDVLVSPADPDTVVGVLMVLVANSRILFSWTNPNERKLLGLTLAPLDRLHLATEIALAFKALHSHRIALGDAHHANVLVQQDRRGRVSRVVLIEPDTWLFEYRRSDGRMEHFTSAARADFLPCEFQNVDLNSARLTIESDRFALVLLLSLALFDVTPQSFGGSSLTAPERITKGYSWLTKMPPGGTVPDRLPIKIEMVPPSLRKMLADGLSASPEVRPTAEAFAQELEKWHHTAREQVAARRFVAALGALIRARTLAEIRQRATETFFAVLRRLRPNRWADPAGRDWTGPVFRLVAAATVLGALAVWTIHPVGPATAEPVLEGQPAAGTNETETGGSKQNPAGNGTVREFDWSDLLDDKPGRNRGRKGQQNPEKRLQVPAVPEARGEGH